MSEHLANPQRAHKRLLTVALPAAVIASTVAVGLAVWPGTASSDEPSVAEARESVAPDASRHDPCRDLEPGAPEAGTDSRSSSRIQDAGLSDRAPMSFYEEFRPGGFTCLADVKAGKVEAVLQTFFAREGSNDVAAVVLLYGTGSHQQWAKYLQQIEEYSAIELTEAGESAVVGLADTGASGEKLAAVEHAYRTTGGTTSMWEQIAKQHAND